VKKKKRKKKKLHKAMHDPLNTKVAGNFNRFSFYEMLFTHSTCFMVT